MTKIRAKKVIFKNRSGEYLYPYTETDLIKVNTSKMYLTGEVSEDEQGYNQLVEMKQNAIGTGIDIIKPDNYEVVGSPVISDDGIVSGFSSSNYLTIQKLSSLVGSASSWELDMRFTTPNDTSSHVGWLFEGNTHWCNLIRVGGDGTNYTGIQVSLTSTGSSYDIASYKHVVHITANTTYWLKLIFTGTEYLCKYSTNGTDFTTVNIATSSLKISDKSTLLNIGVSKTANYPFRGSIDLNAFKIYVDGNLVYQPCLKIPYTESKTGSKIVDVVYRDRVIDLYEQEGQAGYFTIDETNKNFTLPMGEIYGMIETLRSEIPTNNNQLVNGAGFITGINSSDVTTALGYTPVDESLSNLNSTGQALFAGKVSKSGDTMTGLLEIQKQEGIGVRSRNMKMDLDNPPETNLYNQIILSDKNNKNIGYFQAIQGVNSISTVLMVKSPVSSTYNSLILTSDYNGNFSFSASDCFNNYVAKKAMPSDKYIDLTLGASGATYTAPANGYFFLSKGAKASAQYAYFQNNSASNLSMEYTTSSSTGTAKIFIPVKQGDSVKLEYNLTGTTNYFRFIYAEGAKNG